MPQFHLSDADVHDMAAFLQLGEQGRHPELAAARAEVTRTSLILSKATPMKYPTQSVALPYFVGALVIFSLQLVFGLVGAIMYVAPNLISAGLLPFSVVRMIHTNALIVWLLLGFFGSAYFLIPEETERDIWSPMLAKVQFWLFFVAAPWSRSSAICSAITTAAPISSSRSISRSASSSSR